VYDASWRFAQHARVQIRAQALAHHLSDPIHARIDVQASLSSLKGLDPRFKCIESFVQLDRFLGLSEFVSHNLAL